MWRRHGEGRAGAARQVCTSPQSSREWHTDERRHVGQQSTKAAAQEPMRGLQQMFN